MLFYNIILNNVLRWSAFGILTLVIYAVTLFFIRCVKIQWSFYGFPEPKSGKHWLLGHWLLVSGKEKDSNRFKKGALWSAKFGKLYILRFGPGSINVIIAHPDSMKAVLKENDPKPTGFGRPYRHALPWFGNGLLLSHGKEWLRSRRLLTPSFHFEKLKPYVDIYHKCGDVLIENFDKFADTGKSFDISHYLALCSLDIILRCSFSLESGCQREGESVNEYVAAVHELGKLWLHRNRSPWLYPDFIFYLTPSGRRFRRSCNYVNNFAETIIQTRLNVLEKQTPSNTKHLDFLDILLTAKDEDGMGLSKRKIRDEVNTFLFAGHDTTSSAMTWILYSLAEHPHHQRKCQDEIDAILRENDSDIMDWKDLGRLQFLTQCIKEGMRLHSPVPIIARSNDRPIKVDDLTIPAGSNTVVHIYSLHNNPAVWDSPSEFRPERFSKENISKIETYAYVPFAAGPRNCIGKHFAMNEIKIILCKLLRRYNFVLDETHEVEKCLVSIMKAKNGIKVYAERRSY